MRNKACFGVLLAALSIPTLAATPAAYAQGKAAKGGGEVARAQSLFKKADDAYNAKRFAEALELFKQSYATVPSPNSHLYIARCMAQLGDSRAAYIEFQKVFDEADARANAEPKYAPTRDSARLERDEVGNKLAIVTINVAHADASTTVRVSGTDVPQSDWGKPQPFTPGNVDVVIVERGQGRRSRRTSRWSPGTSASSRSTRRPRAPRSPPRRPSSRAGRRASRTSRCSSRATSRAASASRAWCSSPDRGLGGQLRLQHAAEGLPEQQLHAGERRRHEELRQVGADGGEHRAHHGRGRARRRRHAGDARVREARACAGAHHRLGQPGPEARLCRCRRDFFTRGPGAAPCPDLAALGHHDGSAPNPDLAALGSMSAAARGDPDVTAAGPGRAPPAGFAPADGERAPTPAPDVELLPREVRAVIAGGGAIVLVIALMIAGAWARRRRRARRAVRPRLERRAPARGERERERRRVHRVHRADCERDVVGDRCERRAARLGRRHGRERARLARRRDARRQARRSSGRSSRRISSPATTAPPSPISTRSCRRTRRPSRIASSGRPSSTSRCASWSAAARRQTSSSDVGHAADGHARRRHPVRARQRRAAARTRRSAQEIS